MKAKIQTTAKQIVNYWEEAGPSELDMGCDWADALNRCWRCGLKTGLERCHIIPAQEPFNGPDTPSNLVLLCGRCHEDAPCCDDPSAIWDWIKKTRSTYAGSIWEDRLREALEKHFGCPSADIFRGLDPKEVTENYLKIRDARTGLHPGDSTQTAVWTIKEAFTAAALTAVIRNLRDAGIATDAIGETLRTLGFKLPVSLTDQRGTA